MEAIPPEPSNVMTRAGTMLQLVELGLTDIDDPAVDFLRITRGLYCIAVFGRAVTNALQVLRKYDRRAFDEWYAPWLAEMTDDPLCRFFYALRTDLLKKTDIRFGIVLGAGGVNAPAVGAITVYNVALPAEHRGKSIDGSSVRDMCHLYVAYLRELVDSAAPVVFTVHDEFVAARFPATGAKPSATTPQDLGAEVRPPRNRRAFSPRAGTGRRSRPTTTATARPSKPSAAFASPRYSRSSKQTASRFPISPSLASRATIQPGVSTHFVTTL